MASILLVNPAGLFEPSEIRWNPSFPPLGLAYLAAYLRKEGHRVMILDILGEGYNRTERQDNGFRVGLPWEEVLVKIGNFRPDVIGISDAYTKNTSEAHRTAEELKKIFPSSLLIMGGAHCSVLPEEVLKDRNTDLVCIGEGEITAAEVASAVDLHGAAAMQHMGRIPGLALRVDGRVHRTPGRELVRNLDELPFPARDLLPMHNYFSGQEKNPYYMRSPSTSLITSRGCPYQCVYCSVRSVWGRSWRGRSPVQVVDEIQNLVETFGIRELSLCDDALACNKERLKELCREIIARRLDIRWSTPNGVAIWLLDKEAVSLMKKAGCYRLTFGLETGDEKTSAFIRKSYDRRKASDLIRYANQIGFWTIGTFIIGFPMETRQGIHNTLDYAIRSGVDLAVFYSAYPFPGTDLHKEYQRIGIAVPETGSVTRGGVDTLYFRNHEISALRNRFIKLVTLHRLLHGYRIIPKLRSAEDVRFLARISLRAANILLSRTRNGNSTSGILKG